VPATTQNVDAEIHAALRSANKYTGKFLTNLINLSLLVASKYTHATNADQDKRLK
jgi:hypothetical protein